MEAHHRRCGIRSCRAVGDHHIPAIIIAYMYLTDVKGLGCRSGSYVIYGIAGTVAFLLLFASTIFSHAAMLKIQEQRGMMMKGGL
ncbi:hypothetical protein QBC34DRAFT_401507 [Podospora aff. communis PSN243]|uniref:Uncharacterized protein n=1 Tax=Podospora aff. communis PSN243 TaxID=3040156 RepID=A0AAV9GT59_9PEZI|nr:hypothetical protein QBC34DRAFT_401507 [Podospora aff. communis PSN243]